MFTMLSTAQQQVVSRTGTHFTVRACPGGGKTFAVAARLAHHLTRSDWTCSGIAVLSFTNVAWQEIEQQIIERFGLTVEYPHFLGTLDSFLNRFIFLPFGHLVMDCTSRPVLVGEPHGVWSGKGFADSFFGQISFDIHGNLVALTSVGLPKEWHTNKHFVSAKQRRIKAGFASQADANYLAMRILEEYPQVARSLSGRFPMLIVDEAQDTSDIQMRIVELLIANGLKDVALVGDPDQAIFEWHNARPDLLTNKMRLWRQDSIVLNENRRSSQRICDFTYALSSLPEPSKAVVDEVRHCAWKPRIVEYSPSQIMETVQEFLDDCECKGIAITRQNVAVISRSASIQAEVLGINMPSPVTDIWIRGDPCTRDLARGKYLIDRGLTREGFRIIERAVVRTMRKVPYCSDSDMEKVITGYEHNILRFRQDLCRLIEDLPQTDCQLGKWLEKARLVVKQQLGVDLKIASKGKRYSIPRIFAREKFVEARTAFRLGTIHSVKGETFEAVLVILRKKGVGKTYCRILNDGATVTESEELRIVYVGLTRPRRLLWLAVPDEPNRLAWENRLIGASTDK